MSRDEFSDLREMLVRAQERPRDPSHPDAVSERRRRRRRRIIAGVIALVVVAASVSTYLPLVLLAPVDGPTGTVSEPRFEQPGPVDLAVPPGLASAISVTGAEEFPATLGTDGLLAVNGDLGELPMASISKIITTLVVLQAKPLGAGEDGPILTVSATDEDLYDKYFLLGATVQGMKVGQSLTQHDVIELMLVASASNYAELLSTWAYGSQARFLSATRAWLAANGLTDTTFVEPTGIDPRNASTAADLVAIGKLAIATPVIAEIVAMGTYVVPGMNSEPNTNTVLGRSGITGLKTGNLEESGATLLFSATVEVPGLENPLSIVGVILGGRDRFSLGEGAVDWITSIKSGFHTVPLVEEGDKLGLLATPWDSAGYVEATDTAALLTWSDTPITMEMTTTPVGLGDTDAAAGTISYVAGARTATVPLVVKEPIEGPGGWWRVTHPLDLLGK
jgi:D-alanyl-D-alanine carboxypeptidase (penicillin-binding protein 5/6)